MGRLRLAARRPSTVLPPSDSDYGREIAARLARDYTVEARFWAGEMTAVVLRRR